MKKIIPLLFIMITLFACSKNKTAPTVTPEVKMQRADKYFHAKKYAKAYPLYQQIVFERNSSIAADAQMKLAESYYKLHKFAEAEVEYEQLIKLFPDYPEINRAYYQMGKCYMELSPGAQYTQEDTNKAIDAFQTFIDKFPNDPLRTTALDDLQKAQYKLLEKEYNNGYIYYKMGDYSSAMLYFSEIKDLGNKDRLEKMSLYYSAKIFIFQKNWLLAKQTYEALNKDFPKAKETLRIKTKLQHYKQLD
ncbi:MAG TPA: outer membrane protein assembly factor BamD [Candidatus Cloacimonadota bacterium]|nr:outer membrane protein assembly factor BamD [Candidatus Cloacimonadota bacterium]HPT72067.1 outer membrane protein assembly factor BamD [Candidatus Cloacimonadota bacterium]